MSYGTRKREEDRGHMELRNIPTDLKIIKYCKPEHNIRDECRKVQFGSFAYYRELERNQPMADDAEGTHTIHQKGILSGRNLSDTDSEKLKSFLSDDLIQATAMNQNILVADNKFRTVYPNHFIWCASVADPKNEVGDYTSSYLISDVKEFCTEMALILSENITISDFVDRPAKQPPCVSQFLVRVLYHPTREEILGETYCEEVPRELQPYAIKSEKYSKENEIRIIFAFNDCKDTCFNIASKIKLCPVTDKLLGLIQ